ncbi:MAG: hypothetical protein PWP51_804, partial [Clostridiales bacterium]|nr:hypothetical protein [Clostridiales bacterium]
MNNELIMIVDFGGQYNQLIARRVREAGVYSEVVSWRHALAKIKEKNPMGVIFTGGPNSVYAENAPHLDKEIFELGLPILGICYGMQLMAQTLGGKVSRATQQEYGKIKLNIHNNGGLFSGIENDSQCWMSHFDYVSEAPSGFEITATTDNCPVAAMKDVDKKLYAVQFHAEVEHTPFGRKLIKNFVYDICGCSGDWNMGDFAQNMIEHIREKVGGKKVLCALSGGVDSSVAATLVHKAIGDRLTCIFVDHGLLRKDEG